MLKSRLPMIAASLTPRARLTAKAAAELIEHRAKDRVPVRTGRLRDAIHTEPIDDGTAVVAGTTEVFYGHMVEHGTAHTSAHPFLIPALEESRPEIPNLGSVAFKDL
jgi:HK97 gp10 family phage protein